MLKSQVPHLADSLDDAEAVKAVKKLDCLPLGVQLAIGILNEAKCSLEEFNEQWSTPRDVLEDGEDTSRLHSRSAPYPASLGQVYKTSISSVAAGPKLMLQIFSILDPDNIQESKLFAQVSDSAPAEIRELSRYRLKYRRDLTVKGLVSSRTSDDAHATTTGVSMHRLLQAAVQSDMKAQNLQMAFNGAALLVSFQMMHLWDPNSNWVKVGQLFTEFLPHVQAIHTFYYEYTKTLSSGQAQQHQLRVPIEFIKVLHRAAS
jgi:hypothetical protein